MPHKDPEARRAYFREYHAKNKARKNAYARKYYADNPEKMKEQHRRYYTSNQDKILKRRHETREARAEYDRMRWRNNSLKKYGLNPDDFPEVLACEVCSSTEGRMAFDHNHDTGVFRGILCTGCNVALGMVKDNPILLEKLANYLRERK